MQKVTQARNKICPLLDELIVQLDAEGSATQKAHFNRIRGRIYQASDPWELTDPIMTEYGVLDVYQSAPNSQGIGMRMALSSCRPSRCGAAMRRARLSPSSGAG